MHDSDRITMYNLLLVAGMDNKTLDALHDDQLRLCLRCAMDCRETAPFPDWYRRAFEVLDEHVVLTEEGWVPAEYNTREHTGYAPAEVFQEVKPVRVLLAEYTDLLTAGGADSEAAEMHRAEHAHRGEYRDLTHFVKMLAVKMCP